MPHGRRFHQGEAVKGDVAHQVARERGYGSSASEIIAAQPHHLLATQSISLRQTRFRFQAGAARALCGRLFLARLLETFATTAKQLRLLAEKDDSEQSA